MARHVYCFQDTDGFPYPIEATQDLNLFCSPHHPSPYHRQYPLHLPQERSWRNQNVIKLRQTLPFPPANQYDVEEENPYSRITRGYPMMSSTSMRLKRYSPLRNRAFGLSSRYQDTSFGRRESYERSGKMPFYSHPLQTRRNRRESLEQSGEMPFYSPLQNRRSRRESYEQSGRMPFYLPSLQTGRCRSYRHLFTIPEEEQFLISSTENNGSPRPPRLQLSPSFRHPSAVTPPPTIATPIFSRTAGESPAYPSRKDQNPFLDKENSDVRRRRSPFLTKPPRRRNPWWVRFTGRRRSASVNNDLPGPSGTAEIEKGFWRRFKTRMAMTVGPFIPPAVVGWRSARKKTPQTSRHPPIGWMLRQARWHINSTANSVTECGLSATRRIGAGGARLWTNAKGTCVNFAQMADNTFQGIKKSLSSWSLSTVKKPKIISPRLKKTNFKKIFTGKRKNRSEEEDKKENDSEVTRSLIPDATVSDRTLQTPGDGDIAGNQPNVSDRTSHTPEDCDIATHQSSISPIVNNVDSCESTDTNQDRYENIPIRTLSTNPSNSSKTIEIPNRNFDFYGTTRSDNGETIEILPSEETSKTPDRGSDICKVTVFPSEPHEVCNVNYLRNTPVDSLGKTEVSSQSSESIKLTDISDTPVDSCDKTKIPDEPSASNKVSDSPDKLLESRKGSENPSEIPKSITRVPCSQTQTQQTMSDKKLPHSDEIQFIDDEDTHDCTNSLDISPEEYYAWFDAEGGQSHPQPAIPLTVEGEEEYSNYLASEYFDAHGSRTLTPASGKSYEDIEIPPLIINASSVKAREWVKSFNDTASKREEEDVTREEKEQQLEQSLPRSKSETQLNSVKNWTKKDKIVLNTDGPKCPSSRKNILQKLFSKESKNTDSTDLTTVSGKKSVTDNKDVTRKESIKKIFGVKSKLSHKTQVMDLKQTTDKDTDLSHASSSHVSANTLEQSSENNQISLTSSKPQDEPTSTISYETNESKIELPKDETEELLKEIENYLSDTDNIGSKKPEPVCKPLEDSNKPLVHLENTNSNKSLDKTLSVSSPVDDDVEEDTRVKIKQQTTEKDYLHTESRELIAPQEGKETKSVQVEANVKEFTLRSKGASKNSRISSLSTKSDIPSNVCAISPSERSVSMNIISDNNENSNIAINRDSKQQSSISNTPQCDSISDNTLVVDSKIQDTLVNDSESDRENNFENNSASEEINTSNATESVNKNANYRLSQGMVEERSTNTEERMRHQPREYISKTFKNIKENIKTSDIKGKLKLKEEKKKMKAMLIPFLPGGKFKVFDHSTRGDNSSVVTETYFLDSTVNKIHALETKANRNDESINEDHAPQVTTTETSAIPVHKCSEDETDKLNNYSHKDSIDISEGNQSHKTDAATNTNMKKNLNEQREVSSSDNKTIDLSCKQTEMNNVENIVENCSEEKENKELRDTQDNNDNFNKDMNSSGGIEGPVDGNEIEHFVIKEDESSKVFLKNDTGDGQPTLHENIHYENVNADIEERNQENSEKSGKISSIQSTTGVRDKTESDLPSTKASNTQEVHDANTEAVFYENENEQTLKFQEKNNLQHSQDKSDTKNSESSTVSSTVRPKPLPRTRKGKYGHTKESSLQTPRHSYVENTPFDEEIELERDGKIREKLQTEHLEALKTSNHLQVKQEPLRDSGYGKSVLEETNAESDPIYCEIGESTTATTSTAHRRPNHQKKSNVNSYSSQDVTTMSQRVPEWIQQRPPIPSPRNKKTNSTQSLIQSSLFSPAGVESPSIKVFGASFTNLNFDEPKNRDESKWAGDDFYSGKAASIAYGITSRRPPSTDLSAPPSLPPRTKKPSLVSLPSSIPHEEPSECTIKQELGQSPNNFNRDLNQKRLRRRTAPDVPPKAKPRRISKPQLPPVQTLEESLRSFMETETAVGGGTACRLKSEDLLADTLFSVNSIMGQEIGGTWGAAPQKGASPNTGSSTVTLGQVRSHLKNVFQVSTPTFDEILENVRRREAANVTLTMKIIEAVELRAKTVRGASNPFVTIDISGTKQRKTHTEHETLNPQWKEEFKLKVKNLIQDIVKLEVWHDFEHNIGTQVTGVKDLKSLSRLIKGTTAIAHKHEHHLLGTVKIPLKDIREHGVSGWFPLIKDNERDSGKQRGSLHIEGYVTATTQSVSITEARRSHDALLARLIYHHIKTVSNNNQEEENINTPWHGQLSPEANAAVAQHAIILGLTPALQSMSWWIVGSRVPTADAGWLLNQLKSVQKHLSGGLYDLTAIESLADSYSVWIDNTIQKLRNLRKNFPPQSGVIAKHQFASTIATFVALESHKESCDLLERKEIKNLKNEVKDAITVYLRIWWGQLIDQHLKGETRPEIQIQKIIIITSEVYDFLCDVNNFYSPVLYKEMNIKFFREIYLLTTKKLNPCVRPPIMNMYHHLENMAEPTSPNGTERGTVSYKLEDGSNLWNLYVNLGRINKLAADLPIEIRKESGIFEYHKWFNKGVRRWVEQARIRALQMIKKAVDLDSLDLVDEYCNFSSSATDVSGIFTDVQIWWHKLEWPDPENSIILLAKILEDVCSYAMEYADLLKKKVQSLFNAQNNTDQLVISQQICTGLNNIERVRDELTHLPDAFGVRFLIEKVKYSQTGGEDASSRFNNNVKTLIEHSSENMEGKVVDFIEAVIEKMTESIHKAVIQTCENGSEKYLLQEILDPTFQLLHERMNTLNFKRFLQRLWEGLIKIFYKTVTQNTDKRKPTYFNGVFKILESCLKFFSPSDGAGMDMDEAKTQEYIDLLNLLGCLRLTTDHLISKYYSERCEEQDQSSGGDSGELVVRAFFTKVGKLTVEVIMAKRSQLSGGQPIDSYVKLQLVPADWFPNSHEEKTKTLRSSNSFVYEESFDFDLQHDNGNVSGSFLLFTLKDHNLTRSNTFVGEALIPLKDLTCVELSEVLTVQNTYLRLTQPAAESAYHSLQALKWRPNDRQGAAFLKKLHTRQQGVKLKTTGLANPANEEEKPKPKSPRLLRKIIA